VRHHSGKILIRHALQACTVAGAGLLSLSGRDPESENSCKRDRQQFPHDALLLSSLFLSTEGPLEDDFIDSPGLFLIEIRGHPSTAISSGSLWESRRTHA
jgi:hypothetical protein